MVTDELKTRAQLIAERDELRRHVRALETLVDTLASDAADPTRQGALHQVGMLYRLSNALIAATTLDELLRAIVAPLLETGPCNARLYASVGSAPAPAARVELLAQIRTTEGPHAPLGAEYDLQDLPLGDQLFINPHEIAAVIDRAAADPPVAERTAHLMQALGARALVALPLITPGQRWIGALIVDWPAPRALSRQEAQLYAILGPQLATLVENRRLFAHIQASEERYRLMTENATDMISRHTLDGIYLYVSPACRPLLGYAPEEMLGRSAYDFFHPDDLTEIQHSNTAIQEQPIVYTASYRIRRKDGDYIWFETTSRTIRDAATGAPQEIMAVSRNITRRKAAEEALRSSEQRFRQIVETAGEGIWIIDAESRTTFVNRKMAEMLGWTPEAMLGRSLWDFIDEEGRAIATSNVARPRQGIEERHDFRFRRSDGRAVWTIVATTPIQDETGAYAGALAMITDITERKAVEEQLRLLGSAVQQANEAICITTAELDPPGPAICFVNPAFTRMTGYSAEEVMGKTPRILQGPRTDRAVLDRLRRDLEQGRPFYGATVNYRKDGTPFDIEWRIAPIRDDQGVITHFVAVQHDITERKASEVQVNQLNADLQQRTIALEATNRELEAFSYSVSHDLRAPLRSIDGFSQALCEDYADRLDAEGQNYLNRISAAARRMSRLIDDLLNLSRLTRSELQRTRVDLSAIAHRVIAELRQAHPHRAVEVRIAAEVIAEGDPRLLQVVLENLLGNAWKFTSQHPTARIEFDVIQDAATTVYFVRDDGAGFDMLYAGKLFGPFQRLHGEAMFPGVGVGLAT